MDRKIAGLLGAAAAVTAVTGAQAAPAQPATLAPPASYNDLLEPIPNAVAMLKADDAARAQAAPAAKLELVAHHHHHHHHHGGFVPGLIGGFIGGMLAPRECYWVWSRPYWNGYHWVRRREEVCE